MENNGVNPAVQNGGLTNQARGSQNGQPNQQQQQIMAQVFANFLNRFMSVANENANNG